MSGITTGPEHPRSRSGGAELREGPDKKIVVSYSSINGNDSGLRRSRDGTKGTLILEREQEVMLYKSSDSSARVSVKETRGPPCWIRRRAERPTAALSKAVEAVGPVSKGYTEEIEHWAWCIRNKQPQSLRCRPEIAMGDAVIALTTNVAIKKSMKGNPFRSVQGILVRRS